MNTQRHKWCCNKVLKNKAQSQQIQAGLNEMKMNRKILRFPPNVRFDVNAAEQLQHDFVCRRSQIIN